MIKNLFSLVLLAMMMLALGCAPSKEIKEPSREGFIAGEMSPATSDSPKKKAESFQLEE